MISSMMIMMILVMILMMINHDHGFDDIFCTQTLGAGSVEEQLAFEARYEFVTITKVNVHGDYHDDDPDDHRFIK